METPEIFSKGTVASDFPFIPPESLLVFPRGGGEPDPAGRFPRFSRCGRAESPFGGVFVAGGDDWLCRFVFADGPDEFEKERSHLVRDWPGMETRWDPAWAAGIAAGVFGVPNDGADQLATGWGLRARGTPFQAAVWRALMEIPRGKVSSYAAVARHIGRPDACRAVGNAVAGNPLALLIPCHRVLPANGTSGNYRWGKLRKQALLRWEQAN